MNYKKSPSRYLFEPQESGDHTTKNHTMYGGPTWPNIESMLICWAM